MPKIILRKGKRGHEDTEVSVKKGSSERELQNQIAVLKNHYQDVKIIYEN